MKGADYTTDDFLLDPEFISWVKNPTPDKDRYWQLWIEAHPGCREAMLEARELVLSIKFQLPEATREEKLAILKNVMKTGAKTKSRASQVRLRQLVPSLKIAAAITFLITSVYLVITYRDGTPVPHNPEGQLTIKEVAKGARMQIRLPDGTKVWINSESRLTYDTTFNQVQRKVTLFGEAFFEVVPDTTRPFIVKSGNLITQALGTSFNIKAFANEPDIEVSLVTGKVGVTEVGPVQVTVVLAPGEKITSLKGKDGLEKGLFNYEEGIGWKDGLLYFKNAGFDEIKKRLERWYGVSIHTDSTDKGHFSQWNYTGKFENLSLEMVLKRMGFTKNFTFSIQDEEIYLHPKH